MNFLSNHELVLVLSYVDQKDVFHVSLVCKLWNHVVTTQKEFWWKIIEKHIRSFEFDKMNLEAIIKYFNPFYINNGRISQCLSYLYSGGIKIMYNDSLTQVNINDTYLNLQWNRNTKRLHFVTRVYGHLCDFLYLDHNCAYDKPISCKFSERILYM